ncbi:chromate transporter [Brevibacterium sanguinis]|uniref:Chromate transporter n=2 Tax=Brevibacterium TaxID=1696 RepID=A0A366IKZ1_9MICO|nr:MULTISPECIES: chromate efflux transporter [Brevibacterium]RBP64723.1 chromate transporter [Brevibacterium sanguinis]RBP71634.1 chromate transporter [Brevibacterium celere]
MFLIFLRLGLTSFGGPSAHLAYFREAFVVRRRWLGERAYADLVALCQFLPGPASSQVGMALGLSRAGLPGLFAAWAGFTLPSALLLTAAALGLSRLEDPGESGWLRGLMAAAVAVVAHAVLGMARSLTPDARRAGIAVLVLAITILAPGVWTTIAALVLAGLLGALLLRSEARGVGDDEVEELQVPLSRRAGGVSLLVFGLLLVGLPVLAAVTGDPALRLTDIFYRVGSLVFGGGHVVLPMLDAEVVAGGLVDDSTFLAGYGLAQAVPGPLFTFSAFLGAAAGSDPNGLLGAVIALLAIFAPAGLLVCGTLPFWARLRRAAGARAVLLGVNAGVVGLLAAALYDPVFTEGISSGPAFVVAVAGFAALQTTRVPPWALVVGSAVVGLLVL